MVVVIDDDEAVRDATQGLLQMPGLSGIEAYLVLSRS
jgi:FixJ family two-component response regulator